MPIAALLVAGALFSAAPPSPWTEPPPTPEEIARYAKVTEQTAIGRLKPPAQEELKKQLEAHAKADDPPVALALTATGYHLGGYVDHAFLFHARAAELAPRKASALNNYGTFLVERSDPMGIRILRAAEALAPEDAAILTNLGNAALAGQDAIRAAAFYERATRVDPSSDEAWLGLGAIWLRRGNYAKALECFAKVHGIAYHRAAAEEVNPPGTTKKPTRLEEPPADRGAPPEAGNARTAESRLELPALPQWKGPDAFLISQEKRRPARAEVVRRNNKALDEILAALKQSRQAFRSRKGDTGADRFAYANDHISQPFLRNGAWLEGKLDEVNARYEKDLEPWHALQKKLTATVEALDRSGRKEQCAAGELEACKKAFDEWCQSLRPVTVEAFKAWDRAYRNRYQATVPLLQEYYRVQAAWLRKVSSPHDSRMLNATRESAIWTHYGALLTIEESGMWLTAAMAMGQMGTSAEACPGDRPEPPPPPKSDDPLPATAEVPPYCPFRDGPFELPPPKLSALLGTPAKVRLTCDDVQVELSAGVASGRYQRVFRSHSRYQLEVEVGQSVSPKKLDGIVTLEGKLKGTVDLVKYSDGRVQATTSFEATAVARLEHVAEVKVIGSIASDHVIRGSGRPSAADRP